MATVAAPGEARAPRDGTTYPSGGDTLAWSDLPAAALVVLMSLVVGYSTAAAGWVPNGTELPTLGLVAALVMGGLALARAVPWPLALGAGLVLAPVAAWIGIAGQVDRLDRAGSTPPPLFLWQSISSGDTAASNIFFLFLVLALFWIIVSWLAWSVLRWRQPVLGLIPATAAISTNVLNFPTGQDVFAIAFPALTLGVLLLATYGRSTAAAHRAGLRRGGGAGWEFWEKGIAAATLIIMLGVFLPPLSDTDISGRVQDQLFGGWQSHVLDNHPGPGRSSALIFINNAPLNGPTTLGNETILTYTPDAAYTGYGYLRVVNLDGIDPQTRTWTAGACRGCRGQETLHAGESLSQPDQGRAAGTFKVQIVQTVTAEVPDNSNIVPYPDNLVSVAGSDVNLVGAIPDAIDAATTAAPLSKYTVQVAYSNATVAQLRAAGTSYPAWTEPFRLPAGSQRFFPSGTPLPGGPRFTSPPSVYPAGGRESASEIAALAQSITRGTTNPYDQATAIETYLRSNFHYTLSPPLTPAGVDPVAYFLFQSKQGYCQYFASAMGDLLRALGIPSRLVNGFDQGTYDPTHSRWIVRGTNLHTWVEVYFPAYGWIAFEPTPDGVHAPFVRSSGDSGTDQPSPTPAPPSPTPAHLPAPAPPSRPNLPPVLGLPQLGLRIGYWLPPLALLTILAAGLWVGLARFLRPRRVAATWRRAHLVSRLAGLPRVRGETPLEFGARLATALPEAGPAGLALAEGFVVAAYAPPEAGPGTVDSIREAWEELLPRLLRRALGRLRPGHFRPAG